MGNILKPSFLLLLLAHPALAGMITFEQEIDFYAPLQSQWEQGGSATSFSETDQVGGSAGFRWTSTSSSGSIEAKLNGQLSVDYHDYWRSPGQRGLDFSFQGDEDGGWYEALAGASFQFGWFIDWNIINAHDYDMITTSYLLNTGTTFTPQLPTLHEINWGPINITLTVPTFATDSDSEDVVDVSAGLNVIVASASMGASLTLNQTTALAATGIDGAMVAVHRETGERSTQSFSLNSKEKEQMELNLPKSGYWDVYLVNLNLNNTFINEIDVALQAYIHAEIPYIAERTWPWDIAEDQLFYAAFPLNFTADDYQSGSFEIYVAPEPASYLLLLFGLFLLGYHRQALKEIAFKAGATHTITDSP